MIGVARTRTVRLAILGESPCQLCYAACCKQNGHGYAVLLVGDERRKFAAFAVDVTVDRGTHPAVEKALPYRGGRCVFLDDDDRCTIYDDRPLHCRRFQCISGYHQNAKQGKHSEFLERNPKVLSILESM